MGPSAQLIASTNERKAAEHSGRWMTALWQLYGSFMVVLW
jgi:hypothetical protein